jgi:hypothetical protein
VGVFGRKAGPLRRLILKQSLKSLFQAFRFRSSYKKGKGETAKRSTQTSITLLRSTEPRWWTRVYALIGFKQGEILALRH